MIRTCLREMFYKKVVFKSYVQFTGKHLCWILIFNKVPKLTSSDCFRRIKNEVYFCCKKPHLRCLTIFKILAGCKFATLLPFKRQFHKMVKHTQTIHRQIAGLSELCKNFQKKINSKSTCKLILKGHLFYT